MPGSATDYLHQRVLGHTLAYGAYTMPTGIYVGLTTTAPTAAAPGVEVSTSGTGYARQPAAFSLVGGRVDLANNTASVEYTPAASPWGTIGYFELWDAVTGGNRLYWGPIVDPSDGITPVSRSINTGDILRFSAGQLTVQAI